MTDVKSSYETLSFVYGQSENPFFAVDPGLTIWTWLVFFTLLWVLYKFAWKPILKNLDAREEKIKNSILDAERVAKELEDTLEKKKSIIHEANLEARKLIDNSKASAEKVRAELEAKAREEANLILANANKKIESETQKALAELKSYSVKLGLEIASKIIQDNLNDEKNHRLAKKYLEEIN